MANEPIPDRRTLARNAASIDVQFHVYNSAGKKPLTRKVPGRLINISLKGACLETSQILIDGHHLMLHDDIDGGTPLILDIPTSGEEGPFALQARVLWYNRISGETHFPFRTGIKFIEVSPAERKQLETLIRTAATSPKA